MSDIEKTKPIDALATRVWSGTHWHYPHIEAMISEIERLRKLYDAAWAECEAWRAWRKLVVRYMTAESPDPIVKIDLLKQAMAAHDTARKESTNGI